MSRLFIALADRISAPKPAVWPGGSGTLFIKIRPFGWSSGSGTDHVFAMYGSGTGATGALLGFQRYSDFKVYAGFVSAGGDQRIVVSDAGLFADGVWANHVLRWDAASGTVYHVDGVKRGAKGGPLAVPALAGPTSLETIGNYNAGSGLGDADARSSLAFYARWDRALLDVELTQLQNGAHPQDIPTGLVECIDLGAHAPEQDLQSGAVYAVTGTKPNDDPFMSPTAVRTLAKQFEPILLFHQNEAFTPRDPKWYLERSSLWHAGSPFTDKTKWTAALGRGQVAALAAETFLGGQWLGDPNRGVVVLPSEQTPVPSEEHFLNFAGWEPPLPPGSEVTPASVNRHPALDPASYVGPLTESKPWYYVEHLSHDELVAFAVAHQPNGLDLKVAIRPSSQALLYYFFYPLHQEALEKCEKAGEGQSFATYAGEWACVAVLLDGALPQFIGLTSRNTGAPSRRGDVDQRVGMTVSPWAEVDVVKPAGDPLSQHAKVFVSVGTHGHYLGTVPPSHAVTPFWGDTDPTRGSCGVVEAADDVISGEFVAVPGTPGDDQPSELVIIAKSLIPVVGWIWAAVEGIGNKFGSADELAEPETTATDVTGDGAFGVILRPNGLPLPEAAVAASVQDWNVDRYAAADARVYDCVVSRPAQVWWTPRKNVASRVEGAGWSGRWGPRVTNDPNNRRAGGKCPDFLEILLEAIALTL
jgi:hypothetical protein